jgi:hypothetical protein
VGATKLVLANISWALNVCSTRNEDSIFSVIRFV